MSRVTHINTYAKVFKQGLILKYKLALYWEQSTLKKKRKNIEGYRKQWKRKRYQELLLADILPKH